MAFPFLQDRSDLPERIAFPLSKYRAWVCRASLSTDGVEVSSTESPSPRLIAVAIASERAPHGARHADTQPPPRSVATWQCRQWLQSAVGRRGNYDERGPVRAGPRRCGVLLVGYDDGVGLSAVCLAD
jgi:hypothetical protein